MSSHIIVQDPSNISSKYGESSRLGFTHLDDDDIQKMVESNLAPMDEPDLIIAQPKFDDIEQYLHRIPVREADLIKLYYKDQMKQEQIANLFGITQAAVSYRLARGRRRIQFLFTIPVLEYDVFVEELGDIFSEQDLDILWRMYETTCQSAVAKQIGLTQGRVRHRFFTSLNKIKLLIMNEARTRLDCLNKINSGNVNGNGNDGSNKLNNSIDNSEDGGNSDSDSDIEKELSEAINNSKYGKYYTVFYAISDKHFNILHEVSLPQFSNRSDAQILSIE